MYVYIYIYIYIYTHICVYIYIYIYTHIFAQASISRCSLQLSGPPRFRGWLNAIGTLVELCWPTAIVHRAQFTCRIESDQPSTQAANQPASQLSKRRTRRSQWRQGKAKHVFEQLDSLRGSSVKIGTIQRRSAWPPRKDDTHKSRSENMCLNKLSSLRFRRAYSSYIYIYICIYIYI